MYVALLCCHRLEELADHPLPPYGLDYHTTNFVNWISGHNSGVWLIPKQRQLPRLS